MTADTRRASHEAIKPKKADRRSLILEILKNRSMTVEEVADELLRQGYIKYFDRNFVAPRLTELADMGVVKVVGKRTSRRTGKEIAVWEVVNGNS